MRIAIMGTRGIPANYGGFETFAEELSSRLVRRGHKVWVYCRTNNVSYEGASYRGVHLVKLPTIGTKYLDTPVHTLLSVLHGSSANLDVVLMCNAANAIFAWMPRLYGAKVALNVDGIERLRKKWGVVGRAWYRLGERLATRTPNAIVSDAAVIQDYYRERYDAESTMIAYGASCSRSESVEELGPLGLEHRRYVLFVSRLEPENNAHIVIEAFRNVETEMKLVVVGDAPYASAYKAHLESSAACNPRIVMTGGVYGELYRVLQSHAYCYVQATEVGGTHPALIESMAVGNAVIANGVPENIEVCGGTALVYAKNDARDLAEKLTYLLSEPDVAAKLREAAQLRASEVYSWERVVDQYEELFAALMPASRGSPNRG
jgi:glycosyltransferase involved in cell wall biosynthesis